MFLLRAKNIVFDWKKKKQHDNTNFFGLYFLNFWHLEIKSLYIYSPYDFEITRFIYEIRLSLELKCNTNNNFIGSLDVWGGPYS